jgi:hypothetical protein
VILGASLTEGWAEALRRLLDFRDRAGDDRFFDIGFAELMGDPVASVARLYAWLGDVLVPAASNVMEEWVVQNTRERAATGSVDYRPADFGLDAGTVRAAFAPYIERFPTAAPS